MMARFKHKRNDACEYLARKSKTLPNNDAGRSRLTHCKHLKYIRAENIAAPQQERPDF